MHPLDRINMQPKDRSNGWAFLGTSLPLSSSPAPGFSRPHSVWICFVPCPLFLLLALSCLLSLLILPLFHFPLWKATLPALQAWGAWTCFPPPEDGASLRRLKEKAERWEGGGTVLDRRSGPSSQVSWRSGHSRGDQGAYPVAALPAGRTERPGRLAGHCITFPFALFPAFIGGRIAFPPVAVWGRWGGAVEPGLRRAVSRKGSRCSH